MVLKFPFFPKSEGEGTPLNLFNLTKHSRGKSGDNFLMEHHEAEGILG